MTSAPAKWGELPTGFSSRPAALGDATAVASLIGADQLRLLGRVETTAAHVAADWAGADLSHDSVTVEDARGRVVAAGDCVPSRRELLLAYGHVHPEWRGLGLGAYLLRFFEERAARLGAGQGEPVVVRHYLLEKNTGAQSLLTGHGYETVRAVLRMERALAGPLPPAEWPSGVKVRAYRGAADEPAVYEAFELGSSGMWGRPGNELQQWLPRAAAFDPALFRVAEFAGEVIGLAISEAPAPDDALCCGHVASLRVVPAWRRRGLGGALLADALQQLHGRGARGASLTVDSQSPSGAPRLYLAAGFAVQRRYLVFEKRLGA